MLCSFDLTFHLNKAAPNGVNRDNTESSRCSVVSPKPTRSSLCLDFCPALEENPLPISFAEFDSSVLLSRVSLHLNSTICIDNGNGNEDKDTNIDSVYSEVGG